MAEHPESTIIGESVVIRGNLQGDEDLTVLGRIEGGISLSKTLVIAESGIVKADVSVASAVVSGVLVGDLTASESIEINETGRLVGNLKAPRIVVVAGARIRGEIDMGDLEAPRATTPVAEKNALVKANAASRPSALPERRAMPALQALGARGQATLPRRTSEVRADSRTSPSVVTRTSSTPVTAPVQSKRLKKKVVVKRRG